MNISQLLSPIGLLLSWVGSFALGAVTGVVGNWIFAWWQRARPVLRAIDHPDEELKKHRILHLSLTNEGRQPADCSATGILCDAQGPIARYVLRFSDQGGPAPHEMFAPERYLLRPGPGTPVPVVYKLEGWEFARVFSRPVHVLGMDKATDDVAPRVPPGRYTLKVQIDYGSLTPLEGSFVITVAHGTSYEEIQFE